MLSFCQICIYLSTLRYTRVSPSHVHTGGGMSGSFAFGFASESPIPTCELAQSGKPTPPATASDRAPPAPPATEHSPSEVRSEQEWSVEEVVVETEAGPRHALRKPVQPEALLPELVGGGNDALGSSDLVCGVYEGGFKLWECAHDLMVVVEELRLQKALAVRGARVLEAGCGAGLPGALALQLGCAELVLQDYNAAVLRWMTMPTLRLNGLWEHALRGEARFVSGDWAELGPLLGSRAADGDGFDLILSADTIYSTAATPRLWRLIAQQLRHPTGTALIAAKSYYFGVGGSVADFCALVGQDGRFSCESVRTFEDGQSNRREVLQVRWRDGSESSAAGQNHSKETSGSKRARAEDADIPSSSC